MNGILTAALICFANAMIDKMILTFAFRLRPSVVSLATLLLALAGCASQPKSSEPAASVQTQQPTATSTPAAGPTVLETIDDDNTEPTTSLALPKHFGRFTGDWDQIVKRGSLRVLVVYSKFGFFYDRGHHRGLAADFMEQFENVTNKKLKTGARKFKVLFLPTPPGQLLKALNDGIGDIICTGIIITPEHEKLVDFTAPLLKNDVKLVVVTSKIGPPINRVDDLSGKDVYINPISVAKTELENVNQHLKEMGKPEIGIKSVDSNLTEDDLLEMVHAGLIPATVSFDYHAELWSRVFSDVVVNPAVLKDDGQIGWAMRKGSPQLKAVMDDFLKSQGKGTVFGNMMIQRYVKNTKWAKNSTSEAELKKFRAYVKYFQQYAAEYNFDYLMLTAQGFQESMLDQDRVSPRGAVGVMQILPKYAAAAPINIPNVRKTQDNIHAGAKMLAQIAKTSFNDPGINQTNKTLFTFAAYNAGQNRIVRLRKEAQAEGLDPNKWFGNVELVAAEDIGQETVQYVSNIYKYYVAYKMTLDQQKLSEQAKQRLKAN